MGGAASFCLRMLTVSRAAHRALQIDLERYGIRAATNVGGAVIEFGYS
jgi:hypothetical protein